MGGGHRKWHLYAVCLWGSPYKSWKPNQCCQLSQLQSPNLPLFQTHVATYIFQMKHIWFLLTPIHFRNKVVSKHVPMSSMTNATALRALSPLNASLWVPLVLHNTSGMQLSRIWKAYPQNLVLWHIQAMFVWLNSFSETSFFLFLSWVVYENYLWNIKWQLYLISSDDVKSRCNRRKWYTQEKGNALKSSCWFPKKRNTPHLV